MTAASSWALLAGSWLLLGLVIAMGLDYIRRHAGPWCPSGHRLDHPDAICGECGRAGVHRQRQAGGGVVMGLAESALKDHREVDLAYAAGLAAGKAIGYRHGCNDRSQADADLLDDIRRAGLLVYAGKGRWACKWCSSFRAGDGVSFYGHAPDCLGRRIEARGERS